VRAWAALRPSSVESRFEAMHATGLTALVGREEELELLLRRWSKAKTGEGQVVLLSGEAGIGKSRLTAALNQARRAVMPQDRLRLVAGQSDYFRPCIAMNAAHVRAEAAITTRSGFTVDLADFAIASQPNSAK
jgi:hypothetical protein